MFLIFIKLAYIIQRLSLCEKKINLFREAAERHSLDVILSERVARKEGLAGNECNVRHW